MKTKTLLITALMMTVTFTSWHRGRDPEAEEFRLPTSVNLHPIHFGAVKRTDSENYNRKGPQRTDGTIAKRTS